MRTMIATYPEFSALTIDSKSEIEALTERFDPYSDFNFTSLFCWDTDGTTRLSLLNGNLVIQMDDYMTNEPLYSIIGDNDIDASIRTLLHDVGRLELVPKVVVESMADHSAFRITPDRDQFDYVYHIPNQADMAGGHYKMKRNKISKFMREHGEKLNLRKIHFNDPGMKEAVDALFQRWAQERRRETDDIQREAASLQKLFDFGDHLNLVGIQVLLDGEFVAFSINEIVQRDYAVCHFQKSILTFENVDVFLSNLVAKELKHFGCAYVNWEQDLGLPGLRQLKESYMHEFFLEKFTVELA